MSFAKIHRFLNFFILFSDYTSNVFSVIDADFISDVDALVPLFLISREICRYIQFHNILVSCDHESNTYILTVTSAGV